MFADVVLSGSFTTPASGNNPLILQLPFVPDVFEVWEQGDAAGNVWTAATAAVKTAFWQKGMAPGTALATANNPLAPVFLAAPFGITPVTSFANTFGPPVPGTGITNANPAVLTLTNFVANTAPIPDNSVVVLESTTGAFQFFGFWTITIVAVGAGTTTYHLNDNFDASAFAAPATNVVARQLLFPFVFTPYVSYICKLTRGATTTIVTTFPHGLSVGDTVRLIIPQPWGTTQISGQQGMILTVADPFTFTINIDSTFATAFTFPTSVQAAAGVTWPQVIPFGDQASAFDLSATDNNFQGVIIGNSATVGQAILNANNSLILWKAQRSARVFTTLTF